MTAGIEPEKPQRNRAYRFFMAIFWIGVVAAVILVTVSTWTFGAQAVRNGIDASMHYLAIWRLCLFVILIGGWPFWIALLARQTGMNDIQYRYALAQRRRVAAWLLVIEAVLVQKVATTFLSNLLL